jgi:hypothetical protein
MLQSLVTFSSSSVDLAFCALSLTGSCGQIRIEDFDVLGSQTLSSL